jgi:ABC-type nitrate/sulfonate/bicarbonate transport system substrate-binding protein
MWHLKSRSTLFKFSALLAIITSTLSCSERDSISLIVNVTATSISKLPFVIAMDQGLYAKHGLNVEMRLPTPESEGRMVAYGNFWGRVPNMLGISEPIRADISIYGGNPMIVRVSQTGFSTYERSDLMLTANQIINLRFQIINATVSAVSAQDGHTH